jgi:hypothetical protein
LLWGGFISWGTTKSGGKVIIFNIFTGKTKISQFNMTSRIKEDIFWLEVSVDNILLMNIFNGKNKFSNKESSFFFS